MKILLIGGSGLASTAITQQLLDARHEVTTLNRGRTPVRYRGEVHRLLGDRTDRPALALAIHEHGPWDCVIDMVCADPADAAALRQACRGQAAQVIFCSTTNVYPKPADNYPVREDHRLGASFKNGIDKAACEAIHGEAEAAGEYRLTVIRPGQIYGESGNVLHSLGNGTAYLDRVRRGRPIVVHGDGNGLWSALHAEDVARVFVAAVGQADAFRKAYHAAGEEWFTWDQYQARVAAAMEVALPPLVHIPVSALARLAPERSAQVVRSLRYPGIYDMSSTRRELGVGQRIPFTEGMRRTIQWLDRHAAIEPWQSDSAYDRLLEAWAGSAAS